ncbi:hypothetical protein [Nocardia beijingensis]
MQDYEHFNPLQIRDHEGNLLSGQERADILASDHIMIEDFLQDADKRARDQIASACSPYQLVSGTTKHEDVERITEPSHHFPSARVPGLHIGNCIHCPPDWGGLLGAAVAHRAGIIDTPNPDATEPQLDEQMRRRLATWLIRQDSSSLELLLRQPLYGAEFKDIGLGWEYTKTGLVEVHRGFRGDGTPLLVFGDTAEDFALARLWQLTYGQGIWLPSIVLGQEADLPSWLGAVLSNPIRDAHRFNDAAILTTVSQSSQQLNDFSEKFRDAVRPWLFNDGDILESNLRPLPAPDLDWQRTETKYLAVQEQFDDVLTVPAEIETTGTATMLAPLPPPLLDDSRLTFGDDLTWHVDIEWSGRHSILGRGLTGRELLVSDGNGFPVTLVRGSRRGISYPSRRYDLVESGIQRVNQYPRPKLRDPALWDWVQLKAAQHGFTIELSGAGHKTAQLERMLGGRREFVKLFAGPLLPALRAMRATGKGNRSSDSYPNNEGAKIRANYGVLYFDGIHQIVVELERDEIRNLMEPALKGGVIRSGLALICPACTEKQFQTIDRLGQFWTCERCDSNNDLNAASWKAPKHEPVWSYDLHPVGRRLLEEHGEVPAALSSYLATEVSDAIESRKIAYQDISEVAIYSGRQSKVELDLVAYRQHKLIVGEAKSADRLAKASKQERVADVKKKCTAAVWLEADELVFGTSERSWKPNVETDILQAVEAFAWPDYGPPTVRMITGLDGSGKQVKSRTV